MNIPFHRPIIPNDVSNTLKSSLTSGWLTTGPQVSSFEEKLGEFLEVDNVIAVNSCTAALHLGILGANLRQGDHFIVPTHTFVASVEVGEYINAKPIFVDSTTETSNMDLNQVEDILKKDRNNRIKLVLPVHFAGKANEMNRLYEIASKYGVFIMEDAAHALEARSDLGKVGKSEHAVAFSFYANKNITTAGEGGAITTNNQNLAEKIRKLSLHGMNKDGWNRFKTGSKWQYDVSELGYKYNLTDMAAV